MEMDRGRARSPGPSGPPGLRAEAPERPRAPARAGLLYAADVGLGQVRVLDAKALVKSDAAAREAVLQTLPV
ncbi:hypothetical protein HMI50_42270, partial [Corallococcus carmarthensis]|nr:hypothetical protein [Corallococcus carmarthensis]